MRFSLRHHGLLSLGATALLVSAIAAGCDDTQANTGGAGSGSTSSSTGTSTSIASTTGSAMGSTSSGGATVTIDDVQQQVFAGCQGNGGLKSCHGSAPFEADLDLTPGHAKASLVNQPATQADGKTLVIPGNRDASFLWQKLTNMIPPDESEGKPMPQGEAIMWMLPPQENLDLVTAWIEQGAN